MTALLKQLESAVKRQRSGGRKKKARRKSGRKTRTRTRTVVKHVHHHHRPKAKKRAHGHTVRRHKAGKKRRAKKGGKLSKAAFLRRMALGRARAKRRR